ncbi:MAG: hypothetical protein ACYTHM_04220 [Planctomycetota bacterium]|jgi:hypothetical protein
MTLKPILAIPVLLGLFPGFGCQSGNETPSRENEEVVKEYIRKVEEDFEHQREEIRASGEARDEVDRLIERLLAKRAGNREHVPISEEEMLKHRITLEAKRKEIEAELKRLEEETRKADEKMGDFDKKVSRLFRDYDRLSQALHILEIEREGKTKEKTK